MCQARTGDTTIQSVFKAIWDDLRHTMGSAPTAALMRRAIVVSRECCPSFSIITIEKAGRDYGYSIPGGSGTDHASCEELKGFVNNVFSLLSKLTGTVLVDHLLEDPTIAELLNER